jgi:hypothetical protein
MAAIPATLTETQRQELRLARSKLREALQESQRRVNEAIDTTNDLEPISSEDVILGLQSMVVSQAFGSYTSLLSKGIEAATQEGEPDA